MRILVTGGSGLVGWKILTRAGDWADCWFTYHSSEIEHPNARGRQLDIRNCGAAERLIREIDPDVIIHTAAMTDVDACEMNPNKAREINVGGVKNIIAGSSDTNSHIVFLSSSFVFDGSNYPHHPDDSREPINVYGQTKADAEKLIEDAENSSAIVRTDQPYGWSQSWQSPTMVEWTLDQLSRGGPVEVFDDWYNVPTYLPTLADSVLEIARKNKNGFFHIVGSDYINRFDWALEIANIFGVDTDQIKPVTSSDSSFPAKRPNVYLENSLFLTSIDNKPTSLSDGLERMKLKSD